VAEKRWPIEYFAEVVERIAGWQGSRALIFVEPEGYGSSLVAKDNRILARVDLSEMVALIERCQLLVCNDSGPMHIAGALGVPCVAIFSAGIERMFAPVGAGHRFVVPGVPDKEGAVGVRPAAYDVTQIPPARVLEAIDDVLVSAGFTPVPTR
jgi:ADP-heptose:LPS heptosyltransferase